MRRRTYQMVDGRTEPHPSMRTEPGVFASPDARTRRDNTRADLAGLVASRGND